MLEREEYVQISHSVRYIAMKILLHTDLFLNCHCFVYIFFLFYIFSFFLQQSATQDILDKFDTSPLYFTRTRGLFRECFPGEKTNAPNDGVIGKYSFRYIEFCPFNLHPEKLFEGYPVKSTLFFLRVAKAPEPGMAPIFF